MFTDYQVMRYRRERNAVFVDMHSYNMESNIEMRFSFRKVDDACRFEHDIKDRFRRELHFRINTIIEIYNRYFMGGV